MVHRLKTAIEVDSKIILSSTDQLFDLKVLSTARHDSPFVQRCETRHDHV